MYSFITCSTARMNFRLVLKYEPMVLVRRWLYFFCACTLAAFVSGLLSKQRRAV